MRFSIPALLAIALALPGMVAAQSTIGSTAPFSLSTNPQYPAPYTSVTITTLSSTLDLANAAMTVVVGGTKTYQGNVQPVKVTVGKAGSLTTVEVKLSINGANYIQTVSIRPEDVALVAEPISSAAPLYPGRPGVPLEGSTRVVAVANLRNTKGNVIAPGTLSYAWTVDGTNIESDSGIGKDAIVVESPLRYRSRTISVTATSQDGSLVGGASLSLSPVDPSIRIYENDPLLGILYDHALSNQYSIPGAESTLYAAPFSFPTTDGAPSLQWFLNGNAAQTGNSITLRPTGSGQGNASLSIVSSAGSYTTATANLSLLFGAAASSNTFGL